MSFVTRLRSVQKIVLLRSYRHARSFSHHILPGTSGPMHPKPTRELIRFFPKYSPFQSWRAFSSGNGELFDAAVPFMGEFIMDGTLASFLKSDRVEVDEPIAQIETNKVTIDVTSPEAGVIKEFVAKEGDTVTPGTKVVVILKSSSNVTHVAPSEEKPDVTASQPSIAKESSGKDAPRPSLAKIDASKAKPAVGAEIPKASSVPPKSSPLEPQLPPKE